jgi:hypothetical protein
MISSEVQRTLVKSPPELWAELSDPGSLARHLGDLGEIRITRIEPEQLVEWEAENRTGKVQIKPSGWGTRVTLSVEGEAPQASTPSVEPSPGSEPQTAADSSPSWQQEPDPAGQTSDPAWPAESDPPFAPEAMPAVDAELERAGEFDAEPLRAEIEAAAEAETPHAEPETVNAEPYAWLADEDFQPRCGFFAKLFGRRHRPRALDREPSEAIGPIEWVELPAEPASDAPAPLAAEVPEDPHTPEAAEPELEAAEAGPEAQEAPQQAQAPEQPDDISTRLKAAEEVAAAEVTALLTSVLDRLGAAHHRPFSRS